MQEIIQEVREEVAGLRSAILSPGMLDVADHIFSVETAAGKLLEMETPGNSEERAAMRAEMELLRNELKRLDDLSRTGAEYCRGWERTLGMGDTYTSDGLSVGTESLGSIVIRG